VGGAERGTLMRIDRQRLEEAFEALGKIGETPKSGLTRLALTDEDKRARDQLVAWMRGAGLRVSVDRMGNIFGERAGSESLPPVMMGSHVDSVPTGGKYDGQLGVLCALQVIRTFNDRGVRTRHPITLVIFTNEEGARFQPAMIASGVMAGKIALGDAYNARDRHGIRLVEELERIGYLGPEPCAPRPIRAYLELHIEQGPILAEEGCAVGVVEGIVGISWSRLTLHGVQDHAGPTPMRIRHDPLAAAAEVIRAVRAIPGQVCPEMVTTVGRLEVSPNITNAIPGRVFMTIDIRDPKDKHVTGALGLLARAVKDAASREGVLTELERSWQVSPISFHPEVVGAVERAAEALGCRSRRILSFAGHDAQYMATLGPSGMIFVPSRHGRSHCEEEFTSMDDIEHGANMLLLAALELARQV